MKKILVLLLSVMVLISVFAGCGSKASVVADANGKDNDHPDTQTVSYTDKDDSNYYQMNVYLDDSLIDEKDVDKRSYDFEGFVDEDMLINDVDIIPDAKTAKKYADLIWKNTPELSSFKYFGGVAYYPKNKIWEVWYSPSSELMCGGDVEIAISQKTGEVLGIYYGE